MKAEALLDQMAADLGGAAQVAARAMRESGREHLRAVRGSSFVHSLEPAAPVFDALPCSGRGRVIGITGPTGHGKTTLATLMQACIVTVTLLAALIAKLGLEADATEADAIAALAATTSDANTPTKAAICSACPLMPDNKGAKTAAMSGEIIKALGLKDGADEAAALSAITALKVAVTDPTTATTIAALQGQVATLTAAAADREVNEVVQAALSAGKLVPALKDWAIKQGKADLGMLKAYVDSAPVIAKLQTQTGGKDPSGGGDNELSAEALAGKAIAYQAEQAKAGIQITTAQAVMFVNKGPAPAAI